MSPSSTGFIMGWCIFLKWLPNLTWIHGWKYYPCLKLIFEHPPWAVLLNPTLAGLSSALPSLCDFSPFPAASGSWLMTVPGCLAPARQWLGHHCRAWYHGSCSWTYFFKLKGHLLKHRTSPNIRNFIPGLLPPRQRLQLETTEPCTVCGSQPWCFFRLAAGFREGYSPVWVASAWHGTGLVYPKRCWVHGLGDPPTDCQGWAVICPKKR